MVATDPVSDLLAQTLFHLAGVALCGGLLVWSVRRDARSLRTGFLVVVTAYYLLGLLAFLASQVPLLDVVADLVVLATLAVALLGLLLLPLLLIANGVLMVRRESRSLGNLLSLLAGLALVVLPIAVVWLLRHENSVTGTLAVGLLTLQACVGLLFLVFVVHTVVYAFLARRAPARAIIVLGAGLVDGCVPPLLAGRLRQAISAVAQRTTGTGGMPIVPSGGRGADESRPEGDAMGEWLREHGVPPADILVEDRARTTQENLHYSACLLQEHDVASPYLIVTNNYHAPRAAMLARKLGIDAQAIGSPTAVYFWPSAYLREFVAVLAEHRLLIVLAGLPVLGMTFFTWLALTP